VLLKAGDNSVATRKRKHGVVGRAPQATCLERQVGRPARQYQLPDLDHGEARAQQRAISQQQQIAALATGLQRGPTGPLPLQVVQRTQWRPSHRSRQAAQAEEQQHRREIGRREIAQLDQRHGVQRQFMRYLSDSYVAEAEEIRNMYGDDIF